MQKQEEILLKTKEIQAALQQAYALLTSSTLLNTKENLYTSIKNSSTTSNTTNQVTATVSTKEFDYKMAAHDLISPLSTQFTILDMLKEECLELKEKFNEKLNKALQNIEFLTLSNSESLKISKAALSNNQQVNQSIPFTQLIEGILQLLGIKELHTDVNVAINLNTKKAFYNNIAIVQSIILNLIQNAIKYKKPHQQNTITIAVNDTSNGIEIIIQDTGIGMDEERINQLFKQVVNSHEAVQNSHGFGLYGVAQYVEKISGTITVKSVLNIGSTFTIQLPTLIK